MKSFKKNENIAHGPVTPLAGGRKADRSLRSGTFSVSLCLCGE
jgi:hypothetical protein